MSKRPQMRAELRDLFYKTGGVCAYCRRQTALPAFHANRERIRATLDHRVPLSRGGAMRGDNLVLACNKCNNEKGDMLPDEWRDFMKRFPNWWDAPSRDPGINRTIWTRGNKHPPRGDVTYTAEGCPIVPFCGRR